MNMGIADGLPNSTVKSFAEDPYGYLWIGTFDGLARYDGYSFQVFKKDSTNLTTSLSNNHIETILSTNSGLYIGTSEGLDYLTYADRKVHHCQIIDDEGILHPLNGFIISLAAIDSTVVAVDTYGNIWKGKSDLFTPLTTTHNSAIKAVCPYRDSLLVMLTIDRLILYNIQKEEIVSEVLHHIPLSGKFVYNNVYYSSLFDLIIVGSGIGLPTYAFHFDGIQLSQSTDYYSLPANLKATIDYGDAIYFATDGEGLISVNPNKTEEREEAFIKEIFTPHQGLADFAVHSLYKDKNENLWIGTYRNGISLLSPRLDAFGFYSIESGHLTNNCITSIYAQDGVIFAGTDGGGLNIIDTHKGDTHIINKENSSLPADNIWSIVCDGEDLWLGIYNHGIFHYDLEQGSIKQIDLSSLGISLRTDWLWEMWNDPRGYIIVNGTQINTIKPTPVPQLVDLSPIANPQDSLLRIASTIPELQKYELLCAYQDADGILYYGTTVGIISVRPHGLTINKKNKPVDIQFDELSVLKDGQHLPLAANTSQEIKLNHNQNYLTIHFSIPRITPPEDSRFRYRLEGIEPNWREVKGMREVSYTALPPGRYTFHIVCDNAEGGWSNNESTLAIRIMPPWYNTWWAYLAEIILALSIVLTIIRIYISRKQIKYELLYQKRKQELSERERQQEHREHEQKERVQQERLNFFAYITHELRTPMFLITAPLEEILEKTGNTLSIPRFHIENMLHNTQRVSRLIDHILYTWQPERSPLQCNLENTDIIKLCQRLSSEYKILCEQKKIDFKFTTSIKECHAPTDVEKLELMLSNLVSNAFKYTPMGGSIVLTLDKKDTEIVLSVSDTGIGISPEELPHIFQPGYRSNTTNSIEGYGLGLNFVKQLSNLLGGDVLVTSEEGKGSTFVLILPIKEMVDDAMMDPSSQIAIPTNPTATHTILIIDDEIKILQLLSHILGKQYHILTATDGIQGLSMAQQFPDLIICDVMMPCMDGFEFVATIKDNKDLQHIPVIMFTARNMDEDQIMAFRHGADAYLKKPVSIELLRTRVHQLLHRNSPLNNHSSSMSKEDQQFIHRIKDIIGNNLQNPQLSVDFLANHLGMSVSSLYKKVHAITGHSTIDLIIDYRIFQAVEFMRDGQTNMTLIAEQCGFSDLRSFRAAFKSRMNVSPKQYAQQL